MLATPTASSPAPLAPTEEQPTWHWIPLGSTVSVLVFALLTPGVVSLGQRVLGHFYGHASTPAAMSALRAGHPVAARVHEGAVGTLALLTLAAAVALGGYVIGRYGPATNARHGTLSGLCTAALLCAVTRMPAMVPVFIPLGMIAGYLGARFGVYLRDPR